jgi:hypothetical protein
MGPRVKVTTASAAVPIPTDQLFSQLSLGFGVLQRQREGVSGLARWLPPTRLRIAAGPGKFEDGTDVIVPSTIVEAQSRFEILDAPVFVRMHSRRCGPQNGRR